MAKLTVVKYPEVPPSEMEAAYQADRCDVRSTWHPVPGGVRQHERRTRAWLEMLEREGYGRGQG